MARFNRANLGSTMQAAAQASQGDSEPRFVFATGVGYSIKMEPPPFHQDYYVAKFNPIQNTTTYELVEYDLRTNEQTITQI